MQSRAGIVAYHKWTTAQADWSTRVSQGQSLTEECAKELSEALLSMLGAALDIRNEFVMPSDVLLTMRTELMALFAGHEPEFLIPESRRSPQKLSAPQIQTYIQDAVSWIHQAQARGATTTEARKEIRDAFAVSKSTVSAWEKRYPVKQDLVLTWGMVRSAGRLYQKANTT